MTERFDIIGDIHGCADQLQQLLEAMGYKDRDGFYRHPERRAIFLGDFIDRGPQQARTLQIVRPMIESGSALAVMGNHEFNAICYATPSIAGFVRQHNKKNAHQHAAFLLEYPFGSEEHADAIRWFSTLPIYLDLHGLAVVHACWSQESFAVLSPFLKDDKSLSPDAIEQYAERNSPVHDAIECVLKGPEQLLPEALWFKDKDGHERSHARLRWWADANLPLSQRLEFGGAVLSADQITLLDATAIRTLSKQTSKPTFVGHYWLRGDPSPLSNRVACVDYSVAKGGKLVAYRWDGEQNIDPGKFFWTAG